MIKRTTELLIRKFLVYVIAIFLLGFMAAGVYISFAMAVENKVCSWKHSSPCEFKSVPVDHRIIDKFDYKPKIKV